MVRCNYACYPTMIYHPSSKRNLSDVDRDGYLNTAEFCVAMHMAKHHVNGVPLPKTLPTTLKQYAKQEIQFVKSDNQKDRCLEIFDRCKDHVHEGVLEGNDAILLELHKF